MRIERLLPLALLATLLLAGCRSTKHVTTVLPDEPAHPAPQPPREYSVVQFSAEVEGMGVSGQLRIAKDSAMWVAVSKFIEVGRALATPDSVYLHAPLLGREEALDYADLQRRTGRKLDYADLQRMALAPDAEAQVQRLAASLGYDATVRITSRRRVEQLTFPYTKPAKR